MMVLFSCRVKRLSSRMRQSEYPIARISIGQKTSKSMIRHFYPAGQQTPNATSNVSIVKATLPDVSSLPDMQVNQIRPKITKDTIEDIYP
jgi:hypothetical protein